MKWLLILTFVAPDGRISHHSAGIMADRNTCIVAGGGAELVLEASNPGLDVAWTCLPEAPEVTS